jgi:MFS family permease
VTSSPRRTRVSPLRPLRHRAYAIIWTGSFVSNIGTWMETVAIGVYVTQTTGQAAWTGTVAALTYVPTVILGPFGGALADRFDRRRFLAAVTLFATLLAGTLTLLAATGRLSVPAVATIVLLAGCAFAVAMPAVQAMTPDLVPADDLLGAMSLGAAQFNLGRIVGPALAGLVITAGGLAWAFGVNALSFGAVLLALALVRIPPVAATGEGRASVLRTIADGVAAARRDPGIRTALLLLLATTFLVSPFIGLVPAVAIKVFHRGATGTSALVTAQGVGAVCSALAAGPLAAAFGRRRLLVVALLLVGPAAVAYGLAPAFPLAVAAITVLGFVYLAVLSGTSTVCQLRAPRGLRARMASLFMLGVGGGHALGLVVQGWLGDRVGLPAVTAGTGLLLLALVAAVRLLRPDLLAAMDDPSARPAGSGSADVHALQAAGGHGQDGQGHDGGQDGRADRAQPGGEVDAAAQERGEHAFGVAADGQRGGRGGDADHRPLPEQGVGEPDEQGAGEQQRQQDAEGAVGERADHGGQQHAREQIGRAEATGGDQVPDRQGGQQHQQRGEHGGQVLGAEDGRAGDRLEQQVGDGSVAQLGAERRGREDEGHHR